MRPNVNEDSHCKERTSCARRQGNQENREISVGFKKALKNSKTGSVTWPIFKIKTCPEKNILKLIRQNLVSLFFVSLVILTKR